MSVLWNSPDDDDDDATGYEKLGDLSYDFPNLDWSTP